MEHDAVKKALVDVAVGVDKGHALKEGMDEETDEQPSEEIKADVEAALDAVGWEIDIVLTHTLPAKFTPTEAMLPGIDQSGVDRSTEDWLDTIEDRLTYKQWLCGHWHINKHVGNFHILMQDYMTLEDTL